MNHDQALQPDFRSSAHCCMKARQRHFHAGMAVLEIEDKVGLVSRRNFERTTVRAIS